MLFETVYEWAGESRVTTAPTLAISRDGFKDFAFPNEIERATNYALSSTGSELLAAPGLVFARLAYAHPFLDTNGRTLLTLHSEMMRRVQKHIRWDELATSIFLKSPADTIETESSALDDAIAPHIRDGSLRVSAQQNILIEATSKKR